MKKDKPKELFNVKIKKGDKVVVTTGKDKGREGKVLVVNRESKRIIVEGVNIVSRHKKANNKSPQGGIIKQEAPIDVSNVMFVHKGKPTRIGYKVEHKEVNGKMVNVKYRIAKSTGEVID